MTAANRVTIVRILGIPVFILLMLYYSLGLQQEQPDERLRAAALLLFMLLAASDALDGYLARSRGEITRLGCILDPLADKLLLISALVLFTRPSLAALQPQFPVWFTLLVLSRETVLILGCLLIHAFAGRVTVRPRLVGKAATACLMACVLLALLGRPAGIFFWLVRVTGVLIAVSAVVYIISGVRQLEAAAGQEAGADA